MKFILSHTLSTFFPPLEPAWSKPTFHRPRRPATRVFPGRKPLSTPRSACLMSAGQKDLRGSCLPQPLHVNMREADACRRSEGGTGWHTLQRMPGSRPRWIQSPGQKFMQGSREPQEVHLCTDKVLQQQANLPKTYKNMCSEQKLRFYIHSGGPITSDHSVRAKICKSFMKLHPGLLWAEFLLPEGCCGEH